MQPVLERPSPRPLYYILRARGTILLANWLNPQPTSGSTPWSVTPRLPSFHNGLFYGYVFKQKETVGAGRDASLQ
uniref:Uncharacterized protein n=1 Tax=Anguilla anguilla TaxID=7936 RepID=A0A0E9WH92_ANGAN